MIAFLGLGRMGAPLARRLLAAGHDLTVWNRTAERAAPLGAAGAAVAATPAEAVRAADIVITMLADAPALDAVAARIAPAMRPGACLIEMSTVGPAPVRALAGRVPAVVDAPVMGSVDRAADGSLTVLAGGDVDRVADVLAVFGTVVRCGGLGAGAARKILLINAAVGAVTLAADLTRLGVRLGVPDPLDLLADGPLAGAVARLRAEGADFPLRLAAKDVRLALDVAASPLLEAVRDRLLHASDQEADLREVLA
ncbi:NAD(P)-dependent oxidoreductase [Actinoallomurus rhizosphaericola]|uniref:NAD(P)-dependent oxidoreductase n=1 Tax=Actinoallomurus rhizosphaericola TaxID=2952536 RepID=UPI0020918EF3|nr:NAD(P)-binding domain-containing protein [Actinoallomurus rhizosphaericola]MCO5994048.1 NAD(P)-binding domain-containing protein [Actinoallomurus rhizosphaericola]